MSRKGRKNFILMSKRLFQQYVVDMWAKIHQYELNFLRTNQAKLRSELYAGLVDALQHNEVSRAGKKIILPSSHVGSPRWMNARFQDAMAIVRAYGKPDLFITFTCNPNWQEILDELLPGQKPFDRPDLIARVFNIKLQQLKDDLVKKHVFGKVIAYMYTIEFQKRGLPHAHILLILSKENKLRNNEGDFDRVVCAELPDPKKNKYLFDLVKKYMIHTPCNKGKKERCTKKDGSCKAYFPKDFTEQTISSPDGYPLMRRRSTEQGGFSFTTVMDGEEYIIDNR